jgi:predicted SnoaL-like aldol condensation-catalyzing enzyme
VATEENKAVVRRVNEEVVNGRNVSLVDELYSEGYVLHPSLPASTPGPERVKRQFIGMHEEFPDLRSNIEHMVAEGDMVAVRYSLGGTHGPTGKRATWPLVVFHRFEEGKIAEDWVLIDTARIEAQLA